jgi:hypothetical protein
MCKILLQNSLTNKKHKHESNILIMKWTMAFDFLWILLIDNSRLAKFGSYSNVRLLANFFLPLPLIDISFGKA